MQIDFLLPSKIESNDRLRNIITSVTFLLSNFPESKVYVKEVDTKSNFKESALPIISSYTSTKNLIHIFEKSENKFFHKTKILNDLLLNCTSNIVYNYDVDIILPKKSIISAYQAIDGGMCDVVYPFGCGVYQWAVNYSDKMMNDLISDNFNLEYLRKESIRQASTIGWGQMIDRKTYINSYMWNENFISWGAEDCEFYYRLNCLGYRVGRINDDIYHLEHGRTFNSHYHNPKFIDNHNLWNWIRAKTKDELILYYEGQEYIKKRRGQINAGI